MSISSGLAPDPDTTAMTQRFWDFSLALYARPDVQRACLELQDTQAADVNLLLFLLFQASRGQPVTTEEIIAMDNEVRAWRESIIQPLRQLRRQLKTPLLPISPEAQSRLREQIKGLELTTEQLEQAFLETLRFTTPAVSGSTLAEQQPAIALNNLQRYGGCLGLKPKNPELEILVHQFSMIYAL